MKRSSLALMLAFLVAALATGAGAATTPITGVGSARASAVPLRLTVAGIGADLLDISLSATTDPQRTGATQRSASAKLTALRIQGPEPLVAGVVESSAVDGESNSDSVSDDPLAAPGVVQATLQSATAAASVDGDGSRASAGATLANLVLGGGLIEIQTASASMSVEAAATGVTATKTIELPSVSALRISDVANAAGVAIEDLSVDQLLGITNTLALEATGDFGALLSQEQGEDAQIDAAQAALDQALSDQAAAEAALLDAQLALADAQAQLAGDQAAVATAQDAVDAATAGVAAAQAALNAAQAALDGAQADLVTLQSLTLLTPDAIATLQALATSYGVGGTVTALNFVTMLVQVTSAVQNAVDDAQAAVDVAQASLDAAEGALAGAQAALSFANGTLSGTQALIASLQSQIDDATAQLEALATQIAALQATIAALQAAHDATVAALAAYVADLQALVAGASIVTFDGVHIVLRAVATADGGVPTVEVSFDTLSLGTVPVAQDVSTTETATTLLPLIAAAVNGVGGILGLEPMIVHVLDAVSSSGTGGDGYRFASVQFTLLSVSVPTPDGHTLLVSVGDPEVFAEFAPLPSGGGDGSGSGGGGSGGGSGGDGSGGSGSGGSGGSGSGNDLLGNVGDPGSGGLLPVTGVGSTLLPAMLLLGASLVSGIALRRRGPGRR